MTEVRRPYGSTSFPQYAAMKSPSPSPATLLQVNQLHYRASGYNSQWVSREAEGDSGEMVVICAAAVRR